MVSQFTGYPVGELKSGWLRVLTNAHLAIDNLYLKLMTSINWTTGKLGNWLTNILTINSIGKLVNWPIGKLEN